MPKRASPVILLSAALGLYTLLPHVGAAWWLLKPNRLLKGEAYSVWALSGREVLLPVALLVCWLVLALLGLRWPQNAQAASACLLLAGALGVVATGAGAEALTATAPTPDLARVSLVSGVWLQLLALYVGFTAIWPLLKETVFGRWLFSAELLALLGWGAFVVLSSWQAVGLMREFAAQGQGLGLELQRHVALSLSAVIVAAGIGIPAAILGRGRGVLGAAILSGSSLVQTVPSLALFGLLLMPLTALSQRVTLAGGALFFLLSALLLAAVYGISRRLRGRGRNLLELCAFMLALLPALLAILLLSNFVYQLLLALMQANLSLLRWPTSWDTTLSALGVRGIGSAPALLALTLYALLPIVRNTAAGLAAVPAGVREAGKGMGMSAAEQLLQVELPLALPLIVEGLRASAVMSVGIASVTFLIGAGGLGTYIEKGIAQGTPELVLLGALPIIALALLVDGLLRAVGWLLTSPALRPRASRDATGAA